MKSKNYLFLLPLLTGCMSFNSMNFDLFDDSMKEPEPSNMWSDEDSHNKIFVLPIDGPIGSSSGDGAVTPTEMELTLSRLLKDPALRGLILQVNSPGGSASASEELYKLLLRFKKQAKVPVLAYVSDMAASGSYYLSMAADKIVANPSSMVGSIGVISSFISVQGLLEKKLEIKSVTIKSGAFKDTGSIFRDMTKEEINYWQTNTDLYFDRFLTVVSEGRKETKEKIRPYADGRVFHPVNALKANLIDEIGTFEDALVRMKDLAKIQKAKLVRLGKRRSSFGKIFSQIGTQKYPVPEEWMGKILYYAAQPPIEYK